MLRMARQLMIQYEGAIYHLMSRGDRREEIFRGRTFPIFFANRKVMVCVESED